MKTYDISIYTWNENCALAGQVDKNYEPTGLYELQTIIGGSDLTDDEIESMGEHNWAADTTGDNRPRSYDECRGDMAGLAANVPEYRNFTESTLDIRWRIEPTGETRCDRDHTEHNGTEEELIQDALNTLGDASASKFEQNVAHNILEYLCPGEYDWNGEKL